MAKKVDYKKYNCVLEMSKWMGSNPERGCAPECEQRWEGGKEGNKSMQSRKA